MIRINLLGTTKAKSKHSSSSAASAQAAMMEVGDVGSPKLKVLIVAAVVVALNAGWWYKLDRQKQEIAKQMQVAEQKNRELADVKARYLERQREAQNYKRRVDVIDQLRAGQTGPVLLLNALGDTVNGTEAVWLNSMQDQGNSISLQGMALSTDAVANLIQNLQHSGYFKNVEIKETFQDDTFKDMQAFQFTLTCEKGNDKFNEKGSKS
jgi:type IV pilus assembly protein PilN